MSPFVAALSGTFMLFLFMGSGYILRKKNIAGEGSGKMLSAILMKYFMPVMMVHIITSNVTVDSIKSSYHVLITAFVVIFVSYFIMRFLARYITKNEKLQDVIVFSLVFSNFGFMGIPIIEAVYGEQQFMFLVMYTIPYYLTVNILGDYIFRADKKINLKIIFQPVTYGIIIGLILVFFNITPTGPIGKWIYGSYSCVTPLSMLISGIVLGERKFADMFKNPMIYLVSFRRTTSAPLVLFGILYLCGMRGNDMGVMVLIMGMPVAVNGTILAENIGGDSFLVAQSAFISTILSLITLPLLTLFMTSI